MSVAGTMAGKFLLLEDAARHLGITTDELHRLVDRKELFPLRDGTTLKFKIDDLDRLAADRAAAASGSGLSLGSGIDIAAAAPGSGAVQAGGSGLSLSGSALSGPAAAAQPDSVVIGGSGSLAGEFDMELEIDDAAPPAKGPAAPGGKAGGNAGDDDELARTMLGTGIEIGGLESMELDIDSLVGLSGPSVGSLSGAGPAPAAAKQASAEPPTDSGTLDIDLSGVVSGASRGTGSNVTGSLVVGSEAKRSSLSGSLSDAGSALSGPLEGGVSLEDDDAAVSGIDLGPIGGDDDSGGAAGLGGDEFDLGGLGEDDDTGSVVAVEPESGDSSFFTTGGGDSSAFTGDTPLEDVGPALADGGPGVVEVVRDAKFSAWQIAGLVCCSLLLLTGGFVMFDLMRTLGSPGELSLSSPLLAALASVFGWR